MFDLQQILDGLLSSDSNFISYIANLAAEFGKIETVLLTIIVPGVGLMISASAILKMMKMKNPQYAQQINPSSIAWRALIGPVTILLVPFMQEVSESVFGDDRTGGKVPRAMTYSAAIQGAASPEQVMMLGILAFLVFVGWITAFRAMFAFARCGDPQQDGYQLAKAGLSRLAAATVLTFAQFFIDDVFESVTGGAGKFSSDLNL
ncbi:MULTISPECIES: hypothetical protein [Marinobacter]|uniref:Uncharacterized protein n=1 Tax=Marinobacter nauticus (strain ATCC 700491 / DSM 11845 / VT8) TaxID=351348 RepID=A1U7S7_MARN8|nr:MULTISPECIES: hypothetical protein [Marinobacter]ABM21046.1 hypothetical protein Maqu_4195 [Marinobacter nauticus VT8]